MDEESNLQIERSQMREHLYFELIQTEKPIRLACKPCEFLRLAELIMNDPTCLIVHQRVPETERS